MANTGMQRSLTVEINKTVAGVQTADYPKKYEGKSAFSYNGINYEDIDTQTLATMPMVDYNARLNAFKSHVQAIEQGLDFATDTDPDAEAYRVNLTSCPI